MDKNKKINLPENENSGLNVEQIKKWDTDISQAKGPDKKKELRIAFKKTFGVNFSQKLVGEILAAAESEKITSPENTAVNPENKDNTPLQTVESEVVHAVLDLDELVASQKIIEDQEAAGVADPELAKAAGAIDADRDATLANAEDSLNALNKDNLDSLSEADREEFNKLDEELEKQGLVYAEKSKQLGAPGISPEEKSKLEAEVNSLEDSLLLIVNRKNELRGIKAPEADPTPVVAGEPESGQEEKDRLEKEQKEKDEKIQQLVDNCRLGTEFIEIFREFPELITTGDGVTNVEEYIEHVIEGIEKEIDYIKAGNPYSSIEAMIDSLSFITRRYGFCQKAAEFVVQSSPDEEFKKKFAKFIKGEPETPEDNVTPEDQNDDNLDTEPETPRDKILEKFVEFSISEEELRGIAGFSDLTQAQQFLVYEGLKQMSLVKAKDRAKERVGAEIANSNKIGRIWKGLIKKYSTAKKEKEELSHIKYAGLSFHQENLEELTDMISAMKIEAVIEDDELRINYLQNRGSFSPEQEEILNNFNDIANRFSKLPQDWALRTASKEEQEEFNHLGYLYRREKGKALEVLGSDPMGGNALIEMNKADYQVQMMQFLASHPDVDKEFSRIENKSAWKQMVKGEAAARSSYMVSGFAVRHTLAGLIGAGGLPVAAASFIAIPLTAAGIGAYRARGQAKTSLIEKDITGRKNDYGSRETKVEMWRKDIVGRINNLVPTEYALKPKEWYDTIASEEEKEKYDFLQSKYQLVMGIYQEENEKERDKTARHFYQAESLTQKLLLSNEKVNNLYGDDYRTALHYLRVRVEFTEEKLEDGLINFGEDGALSTKLELIQALSAARSSLVMNNNSLEEKEKDLDPEKDLEKRFERLFDSKYFKFNESLSKARKKYIIKEMVKGAGIGAAFAIGGILLRELAGQLGIINTGHTSGKGAENTSAENPMVEEEPGAGAETDQADSDEAAASDTPATDDAAGSGNSNSSSADNNIPDKTTEGSADQALESDSGTDSGETFSNEISNEDLDGKSDSVWRSTREIFKDNAEKLGYEGDINDSQALNKWAEAQTAEAIHNSGELTDKVFEGNNVLLEQDSNGDYSVRVEAGTGAEPGILEKITDSATDGGSETVEPVPLDVAKFLGVGHEETLEQIKKLGWKISGSSIDYGGEKVFELDSDTQDIKIMGDGGEGTRILVTDKDGSMHGLLKHNGEFQEVDMKAENAIYEIAKQYGLDPDKFSPGDGEGVFKTTVAGHEIFIDTKNNLIEWQGKNGNWAQTATILEKGNILDHIKSFSEELTSSEALLQKNGFSVDDIKTNLLMETNLETDLASHHITLNLENNTFSYDWNGETHEFSFQPGEAAKSNMERFLASRGELERAAEGVQDNLMNGKVKSFASLQNQLEDVNGGNKLSQGEKDLWREIYKDNFAKKSPGLLDSGAKLQILQKTMNVFLSGQAK